LNDCLVKGELAENKQTLDILYHLSTGYVGFEAAVAFKDFAQNYESQVTPEDVLKEGVEKLAGWDINKFNALNEKFVVCLTDREVTDDEVVNLAAYFGVLPAELAIHFWSQVTEASPKTLDVLHTKEVNGKPFGLFIADLIS
tara:strand:- start:672 stop:1097 length:426 start_codon:yes stop_codon:yes gene_type:complete